MVEHGKSHVVVLGGGFGVLAYFQHFRHSSIGTGAPWPRSAARRRWPWLAGLFVHLIFLIGFRNKLTVLLRWAYSYIASRRGARVIPGQPRKPDPGPREGGLPDACWQRLAC
jgi:NADH dehydrogenase FAD-containing subunit